MPITTQVYWFTDDEIQNAPQAQGVYALYRSKDVIYYGSSDNVQRRLRQHKNGDDGQCTQSAEYYNVELTSYPLVREKQLLDEYERVNRRLPLCNERRG